MTITVIVEDTGCGVDLKYQGDTQDWINAQNAFAQQFDVELPPVDQETERSQAWEYVVQRAGSHGQFLCRELMHLSKDDIAKLYHSHCASENIA